VDKKYIDDLIFRLRKSTNTDAELIAETISVINIQRFFLEEVHISAKQPKDRSAEYISDVALGKPGYKVSDAGI